MRFVLMIISFFIVVNTFGQKVKIKDGVINVDDVSIAKIQTTSKKWRGREFAISSLSNSNLIHVKEFMIGDKTWLNLTFNNGKSADIYFDMTSFSYEKSIASLLINTHKLIVKSALDTLAINNLIDKSKSEKDAATAKVADEADKRQKAEQRVAQMNLWVQEDGRITSNDKLIGYAEAPDNMTTEFGGIKFYDVNRNFMGEGRKSMDNYVYFTMNDGRQIKVNGEGTTRASILKQGFLLNIAKQLAGLGYY